MARAGLSKQRIIDAAMDLISELGLEQLTARRLAARLGVKAPSLYNHIENLDTVRLELGKLALRRLDETVGEMRPTQTVRDRLLEIADAYRRFAVEEPVLYQLMIWIPSSHNDDLMHLGRQIVAQIDDIPVVQELDPVTRRHFGRAFRSAMHGFVMLERASFFSSDVSVEESYRRMLDPVIGLLDTADMRQDAAHTEETAQSTLTAQNDEKRAGE